MVAFIRRAFNSNLRAVLASDSERTQLEEAGVHEPTVQRFFAWRRSLVVVVVIATILSAGLATYRDLTESEDDPTVFDTIRDRLMQEASSTLPLSALPVSPELGAAKEEEDTDQDEGKQGNIAAATSTSEAEDDEPQTAFGHFADIIHLMSLYALPFSALAVAICWTKLKLSFRILQIGFAFSFFVPMLLALCPWSWWGYVEPDLKPGEQPAEYFSGLVEGMIEGAAYLVTLLPAVLSLIPGVQRASLRVKTLLPESLLPGWFLVAAAPFYALFLLVVFVSINQVASDPIFLVGMFLFLAAPLMYVVRSELFTSPLLTDDDYRRMRGVQRIVGILTMVAGALLGYYVITQDVMGIRVLGLDPKTSLLRPMDLVEFVVEVIGRSMFMTVLGADLLMSMNLKTWQHTRKLAGTPAGESYNRVMGALEQVSK